MKRILLALAVLSVLACKKSEKEPEDTSMAGPSNQVTWNTTPYAFTRYYMHYEPSIGNDNITYIFATESLSFGINDVAENGAYLYFEGKSDTTLLVDGNYAIDGSFDVGALYNAGFATSENMLGYAFLLASGNVSIADEGTNFGLSNWSGNAQVVEGNIFTPRLDSTLAVFFN